MGKAGKHGVSADTPKNILFGAGTIHKNLKYTTGTGWNMVDSIIGATSGGSKLLIVPEVTQIEIDGVTVRAKGLDVKTGETASLELNFIELTKELIMSSTIGKAGESEDEEYDVIVPKADIVEGDYYDNIAFVGKTLDGRNVIAILENALCTSGFEQEGKSKEGTVGKYTFESSAELTSDLDTLPWKIYYPKAVA